VGSSLSRRILLRLEAAEAREPNLHFQDDYRIAWLTVLNASRGQSEPHVLATYRVLGLHPDKIFAAIEAKRRAKLGAEYDKFFSTTSGSASSPKKPVQSERRTRKRTDDERAA
jgi:hypothetical protein